MKTKLALLALLVGLAGTAQAQQGSIHYTGRSTPYTGQMTPVYTGRSTPYTGRPVTQSSSSGIPSQASKSGASIHRSGSRRRGRVNRPQVYRPPTPPALGSSVDQLPARYRSQYYQGYTYYYGNGYYYRSSGNVAPITYSSGFGEHYKDRRRREQAARGQSTDSTRFSKSKSAPVYQVVTPPVGLVVENLPPGTRKVKKGLYFHRDVYYRPTYSEGKVQYIVTRG